VVYFKALLLLHPVGAEEYYVTLESEKRSARLRCETDTSAERYRCVSLLGRGVGGSRDIPDSKSSSGRDSKQLIPEHKRTVFTTACGAHEIDDGSMRHAGIPLVKAHGLGELAVRHRRATKLHCVLFSKCRAEQESFMRKIRADV
jgi:hypothetical protein